jgi:spore coat protein U-like protein
MNRFALIGCLAALALPAGARADSCAATMTDVDFAAVNPVAGSDYYATGTLKVTCSWTLLGNLGLLLLPNVTFCANLGVGSGGGTIGSRVMLNAGAALPFNLYKDATYSGAAIWGNGSSGALTPLTGTMGGLLALGSLSTSVPVYGKVPAAALLGASTVNGNDTVYANLFAGHGTLQYAFYGLLAPVSACTAGNSAGFGFKASATVKNDCLINVGALNFGASNRLLASAVRSTTSMSVHCTANAPYKIALNGGAGGNPALRVMRNPATSETIAYRVASTLDGAVWGDDTNGTATVTGTGTGFSQNIALFGVVPVQRTPSPGTYKDTITATIVF